MAINDHPDLTPNTVQCTSGDAAAVAFGRWGDLGGSGGWHPWCQNCLEQSPAHPSFHVVYLDPARQRRPTADLASDHATVADPASADDHRDHPDPAAAADPDRP